MKKKPAKIIDVLSHAMLPKMEILSEGEKGKVFKKYSIDESQLPIMLSTDPAAIALKASVGDVIKVTRKEETGECVGYRIVREK